MICVICRQAETVEELTRVKLERGEFRLLVNRVPARVCPNCAEAYVEKTIAETLLRIAGQMAEAGILDTQCDYSVT